MAVPSVMDGGYGVPATTTLASVPLAPWQETLRSRIEARDKHERSWDTFVERYQKLAAHAGTIKERNVSLLAAASHASRSVASSAGRGVGAASSNPVQETYVKSLEDQLGKLRDELGSLYKTQSQNAQRLLELNEVLRANDEGRKAMDLDLRSLASERDRLTQHTRDLKDTLHEKDSTLQLLQDEINTLSLELNQVENRNDELSRDNASLLQRWLDAKNEETRMNDANIYLAEVSRRRSDAPEYAATSPSDPTSPSPATETSTLEAEVP